MITRRTILLAAAISIALFFEAAYGQGSSGAILAVDVENYVLYSEDTFDVSKLAIDPKATTSAPSRNFTSSVQIGDIVAVNGQPAKGTLTRYVRRISLATAPNPGTGIADTVRGGLNTDTFEILTGDGSPIGTIMSSGLTVGSPPPGAPLAVTQVNAAIVGGTGAFLGARGQFGQAVTSQTIPIRQASVTEDPANRRLNGGGRVRFILHVIPMSAPQVVATPSGPAITHSSDFSLVTASKPASAGEILSVFLTGLGPTRPGVDPGTPFPASSLDAVNSPVVVQVSGKEAEVLAAVGYPGTVDGYQVNFRVPSDAPKGTAAVQFSAAWIVGPPVSIVIQ